MTKKSAPKIYSKKYRSAIFAAYNKAVAASKTNPRLEVNRVHKAMGLALKKVLIGDTRPYNATIKTCDCPDSCKTNFVCKHRIALMIEQRANELLEERAIAFHKAKYEAHLQEMRDYQELRKTIPIGIIPTPEQADELKQKVREMYSHP